MQNHFLSVTSRIVVVATILIRMTHGQVPPESAGPSSAMESSTSTAASPDANPSTGAASSSSAGASSAGASSDVAPGSIEPATNGVVETVGDVPETVVDAASLFPEPPPLRSQKTSLIGGTIYKLDRVRDQFTILIFGGGKMKISFDPRTHIYNNGSEASVSDLRPGDRISIDTVLDGTTIFARNIRLKQTSAGESQGIVVSYRGDKGELIVRDALSPQPLKLHLTAKTRFTDHGRSTSASALARGTLVTVKFGSQQDGRSVALEVSVLAVPGTTFTFVGRVTALDLSTGLLVLTSATDGKTYEIYLDPSAIAVADDLRPAADVTVITRFDGDRYVAQNLTVN